MELFDQTPQYRDEVDAFIKEWNSRLWLPKILGTDRQAKLIRDFMKRPFARENWRNSFSILVRSKWLREKMRPRFSIDWYLQPDNFDKIMEGKYIDEPEETKPTHHKAVVEDGEERIE